MTDYTIPGTAPKKIVSLASPEGQRLFSEILLRDGVDPQEIPSILQKIEEGSIKELSLNSYNMVVKPSQPDVKANVKSEASPMGPMDISDWVESQGITMEQFLKIERRRYIKDTVISIAIGIPLVFGIIVLLMNIFS